MRRADRPLLLRLDTLPMSRFDREEALYYVRQGESLAEVLLSIARFFAHKPAAPRAVAPH
jgi:hypothetical protein